MNKKTRRINLIICGFAFIVMICYMFFVDGDKVFEALGEMKLSFLIIALGFMLLYWLFEALSLHSVLKDIHKPQKFKDTMTITVLGQYFNCITPFASGGQPIQAYYLVKFGVPLGSGMTALLSRFIVYQVILTLYTFVLLITRLSFFNSELKALTVLTIIGFIINSIVMIALFMLAFFKTLTMKIVHGILKLLAKLRLVKDFEKRKQFIDEEMEIYHKNFHYLKKQPILILKLCFYTILQLTVYFSISYIIYLGFDLSGYDFLSILACQSFVLLISGYVPLPGAVGAAEGSYGAFFGGIFGNLVTFSMFIWRFLTFYFPIIVGLIVSIFIDRKADKDENQ